MHSKATQKPPQYNNMRAVACNWNPEHIHPGSRTTATKNSELEQHHITITRNKSHKWYSNPSHNPNLLPANRCWPVPIWSRSQSVVPCKGCSLYISIDVSGTAYVLIVCGVIACTVISTHEGDSPPSPWKIMVLKGIQKKKLKMTILIWAEELL